MKSKEQGGSDGPNAEIAGALAALRRARLRAEAVAIATGTSLIFARNGRPFRVEPKPVAADAE